MKNTIITFNYDTVLEEALFNIGIPVEYGFQLDRVIYDGSWEQAQKEGKEKLKILKIHGSVNWFQREREVPELTICRDYDSGRHLGRVFLIPPTWRKDFSGPLGDVWAEAIKSIRDATRIIFLGFSFPDTDAHVKYLMAAGLQENISLRNIYCVNNDSRVKKNFFKVIKRDLERQGIAIFAEKYISHLISRFGPQYRYGSEDLNRSLNSKLSLTQFSLPGEMLGTEVGGLL